MRTTRAFFQGEIFKPLDPVDLPENTRLTVSSTANLSAQAISLASSDQAFEFLNDPREDIHSDSDGEPV